MPPANSHSHHDRAQRAAGATLARALAAGEVMTAFQPKVRLDTGELIGVEALARWTSKEFGPVAPEVFIPLAEREGLISELTQLVLREALAACALLRRYAPGITVAVNISPTLLADRNLPTQIEQALHLAGVPPQALVAEVTEGHAIQLGARATLTNLRRRGIVCSIDDFGTGHASLLSLLRLPFSELKIDRAFIARCARDREAEMIVRATIGLAREMQLHVVAEGVETEDTETLLRELGCDAGQGYRYGRPVYVSAMLASVMRPGAAW